MPDFFSLFSPLWRRSAFPTASARKGSAKSFSVFQSDLDGHRLIGMIDIGLRDYESKKSFPWFLGLSTPLVEPMKDGFPTPSDSIALNTWEELVERSIYAACQFVFVGHVTWNGSREALYYVNRIEPAISVLKKLSRDGASRPFAFRYERDEPWDIVSIYFTQLG